MSFESVRQALTELLIEITPSTETLVVGNDPFNWAEPPEVFHSAKISFEGANQIGMAAQPRSRDFGYIRFRTHVRQGLGNKPAAEALDWMRAGVEYKVLSAPGARICLETLVPDGEALEVRGWCLHDADVLFRVHPA